MKYLDEIIWVCSSIFIFTISLFLKEAGPDFYQGPVFIALQSSFLLLVAGIVWKFKKDSFKCPSWVVFYLSIIPILFVDPLFENDQFRYLWEGRAWRYGINPFQIPALEYLNIHPERELLTKVAYPHLTSVYPILSHLWFALFSFFPWKISFVLMKISNAIIVFEILREFSKKEVNKFAILFFPFLIKEFIQGIHIDLLAFYILYRTLNDHPLIGSVVNLFTKVIGALILPFAFLIRTNSRKEILWGLAILIVLGGASLFAIGNIELLSGANQFSRNWIWNPGFYSILIYLFPDYFHEMRVLTFSLFGLFYLNLFRLVYQRKLQKNLHLICYLIFASLMFFSPVYNAWYSIWFLVPAIFLNLKTGMVYGLLSYWGYMYHGNPDLVWLAELTSHLAFIPSLIEIYFKYYKVELQEDPPSTQNFAQN